MERSIAELEIKLKPVLDVRSVERSLKELERRTLQIQTELVERLTQASRLVTRAAMGRTFAPYEPISEAELVARQRLARRIMYQAAMTAATGVPGPERIRRFGLTRLTPEVAAYIEMLRLREAGVKQWSRRIEEQFGFRMAERVREIHRRVQRQVREGKEFGEAFRSVIESMVPALENTARLLQMPKDIRARMRYARQIVERSEFFKEMERAYKAAPWTKLPPAPAPEVAPPEPVAPAPPPGVPGWPEAAEPVASAITETGKAVSQASADAASNVSGGANRLSSTIASSFRRVRDTVAAAMAPVTSAVGQAVGVLRSRIAPYAEQLRNALAPIQSAVGSAVRRIQSRLSALYAAVRPPVTKRVVPPSIPEQLQAAFTPLAGESLRTISRVITAALRYAGIQVSSQIIAVAARAVREGRLTVTDAVRALAVGVRRYSDVIKAAGLKAQVAAGGIKDLTKALEMAAVATGRAVVTQPIVPGMEELPPAGQAIALGGALATAAKHSTGFMKALLNLRWEIFTVMFFMYGFLNTVESVFRSLERGAMVVAAATAAVRGLAVAGVRDIPGLVLALKEASGGYYTVYEAATRLSALFAAGLPAEMMRFAPELMRIARAIAALRGTDVEDVYKGITESIARAEFRMARTHGAIVGNLEDLLSEFKHFYSEVQAGTRPIDDVTSTLEQMGVHLAQSTAALTAQQKQWLILWGVMQHGQRVVRALGEDFDETRAAVQEAKTAIQEVKLALEALLAVRAAPAMRAMAEQLIYMPRGVAELYRQYRAQIEEVVGRVPPEVGTLGALVLWRARILQLGAAARGEALGTRQAFEQASRDIREWAIELGKLRHAQEILGQQREGFLDVGVALREIERETRDATIAFSAMAEAGEEAADSLYQSITSAILESLSRAASMAEQWRYQEEDRNLRWRREDEDLQRQYQQRLEDIQQEHAGERARAERAFADRIEEARRDLARRLARIERELAMELDRIWRDYYDEIWEHELERDALEAIMAARRRDRRIADAHLEAEEERRQAYEAFQDAIEDEQRRRQQELAELEARMRDRLAEVQRWYQRELEERRIARERELEDERIAREREMEALRKDLALRLAEIQISSNRQLTEQEKFQALAYATLVRYSNLSASEVERLLNRLLANYRAAAAALPTQLALALQQALALRAIYEPLLTRPIVIPVVIGQPPGGYQVPPQPQPRPVPRALGGVDVVRRPTLFLAGESGPEVVVVMPMDRIGRLSGNFSHSVTAVVRAEVDRFGPMIENAVRNALLEVVS